MARLGEILVHLDLITEVQLHEGLSSQVLYGGRLGTNLVELGYLTLDQLAKALARRHRAPAALGQHFERCDPALQARVPSDIAGKWRAVPIGRLAHDQRRLAVAVRDPLPEHGRGELAFQLDVEPEELVFAIAPELRIHYHLEVAYQIPRANRFMRVKSRLPTELPVVPDSVDDSNIEGWAFQPGKDGTPGTLVRSPSEPDVAATERPPRTLPPTNDPRIEDLELGVGSDPALKLDSQLGLKPLITEGDGSERRHFVATLGDTPTTTTLARIAVRQVASESGIRLIQDLQSPRPLGVDELARAVRRAETRDRVGELILDALGELPGAPLDVAAIFVARPPLAIGWKGFCEDGNAVIESLAVPLDQPGLIADAYVSRKTHMLARSAITATVIDERMWSLLGGRPAATVLVAPIAVAEHVVCILYVQSSGGLGPAEAMAVTLADAAATAFGRLLRAAHR